MRHLTIGLLVLACAATVGTSGSPPIRGFFGDSAAAERDVEKKFQAIPSPDNLREYMRTISASRITPAAPGAARSPSTCSAKFKSWGLDARIEEFEALMPYPTERVVELVAPDRYVATLKEPPVERTPIPRDAGPAADASTPTRPTATSPASLVYVNYGTPEDYEQLAKLGIDVKGKIVIARYGRSWRGIKPKVA